MLSYVGFKWLVLLIGHLYLRKIKHAYRYVYILKVTCCNEVGLHAQNMWSNQVH